MLSPARVLLLWPLVSQDTEDFIRVAGQGGGTSPRSGIVDVKMVEMLSDSGKAVGHLHVSERTCEIPLNRGGVGGPFPSLKDREQMINQPQSRERSLAIQVGSKASSSRGRTNRGGSRGRNDQGTFRLPSMPPGTVVNGTSRHTYTATTPGKNGS